MPFFTEAEIRNHAFSAIIDQGRKLFEQNRVLRLSTIGDEVIGDIKGDTGHRIVVSRECGKLRFSCTCGFNRAGACEHAVAAMLAANEHSAIQVGIDWEQESFDFQEFVSGSGENSLSILECSGKPYDEAPVDILDLPGEKPVLRLYLSEQEGILLVEVRFAYNHGSVEFSKQDPALSRIVMSDQGIVLRVHRSKAREASMINALVSYDLKQFRTGVFTPENDPRIWTLQQLPQLAAAGYEIYGQERLQSTQARKSAPKLTVRIDTAGSCIDCTISISIDGIPATLAALAHAVRQKCRFILLTDGSSGIVPQKWIDTFSALFSTLDEEPGASVVRIRSSLVGLAETLYAMADERCCDDGFALRTEAIREFSGIMAQTVPDGFSARFRPYQKAGFDWFYFLKRFHFGGCLADDMGLGKTVQTLALLLKEKQLAESQPSLVVVPNSLLFNWQRECRSFAPSLNVLIYHGSNRSTYSSILHMTDVVLTTYGTVVRDVEKLKEYRFHYIILDEAQAIKNPSSQASAAVRSLHSNYRLALSGTPIENNCAELWALFSFLNPGMLGPFKMFLKDFIKPIERDMNRSVMEILKKMVFPFILRRTKSQVAAELPPKSRIVVYSEMVPRQRMLYEITRELYYSKIRSSLESGEKDRSPLVLLEGLLRLRQICTHPKLFDESYQDESGKFETIEQLLRDAVAEGHRILVFSQFVRALELLRIRISCAGITSELLCGATRDREKVIDRFQSKKSAPVFLVSLKAGGTGLNLTAADYVFHLDPWWNLSAENQASDRAYRIGQKKPVFVYKLIMRDSIEERVLGLQERKRLLMDGIIQTDSTFIKQLSGEDLIGLFEK